MGHELYFVDGRAQMFLVGDPSWHALEQRLEAPPSYEDAITKFGINYPLSKKPFYIPARHEDPTLDYSQGVGEYVESGDAFYVFREDTKKILGRVGAEYEIVENKDAFEILRPLVDSGLLRLETGGVLRDGADAWMLGRWDLARLGDTAREFMMAEGIVPFSAVMANHSGRRAILLGNTPIRVVCANTMGQAERGNGWISVSHKGGAHAKLADAAMAMFHKVVQNYETIAKQYSLLKATPLVMEDFEKFVLDEVAPDPRKDPKFNPEAKLAQTVLDRADRKRERLKHLWVHGIGHTGDLTAWWAYNSATQAIDHDTNLWPRRDGSWASRGLLGSTWQALKTKVLDNLVRYAKKLKGG